MSYTTNSQAVSINVLQANQGILFSALPNRLIGDAAFTLNATASSGLPVSFSVVSGPASVVGNAVTLGATQGQVIIRASQGGNTNYNAAPNVDQTFFLGTPTYPIISQQPASQAVVPGDRVIFTVVASGVPLTYQWFFMGSAIPGETGPTLTLQRVNSGSAGPYNVIIGNSGGSVASTVATLTVNVNAGAPVITTQPQSSAVTAGSGVILSVAATGAGLTYQWYQGTSGNTNTPINGATGATYTTPALGANANFWVVVKNASGLTDSTTANISVQAVTTPAALQLNMLAGLTVDGTTGGSYRIEYATNLTSPNWIVLTNLVLPASRNYFADWGSTNAGQRYYRLVSP